MNFNLSNSLIGIKNCWWNDSSLWTLNFLFFETSMIEFSKNCWISTFSTSSMFSQWIIHDCIRWSNFEWFFCFRNFLTKRFLTLFWLRWLWLIDQQFFFWYTKQHLTREIKMRLKKRFPKLRFSNLIKKQFRNDRFFRS